MMKIVEEPLPGVKVFHSKRYSDKRGYFYELYNKDIFQKLGVTDTFVQDSLSHSHRGVLRGLHYTKVNPQAQLLSVINGEIFDVVVDMRRKSLTFGNWYGVHLGGAGPGHIYMPPGFAHGFCVLSDFTNLHYKATQVYDPKDNFGIIWNDPTLAITWPVEKPIISERDQSFPCFELLL
jgi:dTDP-4-dehydrorhamnose 3,5-epimerase